MRKRANRSHDYAVYRGDTFLDLGKAESMARTFGVKVSTIKWMSSPTGLRRSLKKGRMIVIKIEEED
jgi:hypothetical protein